MMALAVVTLGGCDRVVRYQYRMTVEVETPQGLTSASNVIGIRAVERSGITGSTVTSKIMGEAIAVDVAKGRTLFALFENKEGTAGAFADAAYDAVLPHPIRDNVDWRQRAEALKQKTKIATVPPEYYPILGSFTDTKDPRSVQVVDPSDLARTFGPT